VDEKILMIFKLKGWDIPVSVFVVNYVAVYKLLISNNLSVSFETGINGRYFIVGDFQIFPLHSLKENRYTIISQTKEVDVDLNKVINYVNKR